MIPERGRFRRNSYKSLECSNLRRFDVSCICAAFALRRQVFIGESVYWLIRAIDARSLQSGTRAKQIHQTFNA
jgi:hypothetical protein